MNLPGSMSQAAALRHRAWDFGALWLIPLATLPIRMGAGLAKVSLFEILVLPLLILELRRSGPGLRERIRHLPPVAWVALAFLGWCVASILWAPDRLLWAKRTVTLLEAVAAAFAVYLSVRRCGARAMARITSWSGLVASVIALVWFYALGANPLLTFHPPPDMDAALSQALRLGSPIIGPSNYFATFLMIAIPMAFYLSRGSRLHQVSVALQLIALVSTVSRGAIFALIGVGLVALPLGWKWRELQPRTIGIGVVSLALGTWFAPRGLGLLLSRRQLIVPTSGSNGGESGSIGDTAAVAMSDTGRLEFFKAGWALVRERPVTGHGVGNWNAVTPKGVQGGAHNSYLNIAAETGVVGLGLALAVLGFACRRVWSLRDHLLRYTLAVALGSVLVNAMVEASFEGVAFAWFFLCFLGSIFGVGSEEAAS